MDEDTLLTIFRAPDGNKLTAAERTDFTHGDPAVFADCHAVHAAFRGKHPCVPNLKIFREDTHGMVSLRRDLIRRRRQPDACGSVHKFFFGKIRRRVGAQCKAHRYLPLLEPFLK